MEQKKIKSSGDETLFIFSVAKQKDIISIPLSAME